jgi:hypothetical protein
MLVTFGAARARVGARNDTGNKLELRASGRSVYPDSRALASPISFRP